MVRPRAGVPGWARASCGDREVLCVMIEPAAASCTPRVGAGMALNVQCVLQHSRAGGGLGEKPPGPTLLEDPDLVCTP